MLQLTFYPELTLTGFRTTRLWSFMWLFLYFCTCVLESLRKTYESIYRVFYSSSLVYTKTVILPNVGGQWLAFTNSIEETILKDTIVRNSTAFPVRVQMMQFYSQLNYEREKVTE